MNKLREQEVEDSWARHLAETQEYNERKRSKKGKKQS